MREDLGYVAESDLDLILVLDAHMGGPLTRLLLSSIGVEANAKLTARRSTLRCAGTRETDVELSWEAGIVFVEDKVDTGFTLGQPGSYRQEVMERRARGEAAWSVLVCPGRLKSSYLAEAGEAFDSVVTCEELADAGEEAGDSLSHAAALVFRAGRAEADRRSRVRPRALGVGRPVPRDGGASRARR